MNPIANRSVRNAIDRSQAVVVACLQDNGNNVTGIYATPRGIVLTGASAGQPDNLGFARYYAATMRLRSDPVLITSFKADP